MIRVRSSDDRGHANHGWLDSYHTFSFADYYDPAFMGFRSLRVINEDVVAPGKGFGTHPHHDMEILTYVLEGELEHKDSMGNRGMIRPGELQYMSAGTGVRHSEFNPSKTSPVHLFQIWILPNQRGLAPNYDQRAFAIEEGKLTLIAAPQSDHGAMQIHQDVNLYSARLNPKESVAHTFSPGRAGYLQMAKGGVTLNGHKLQHGDGVYVEDETNIDITNASTEKSEFLLFDLA